MGRVRERSVHFTQLLVLGPPSSARTTCSFLIPILLLLLLLLRECSSSIHLLLLLLLLFLFLFSALPSTAIATSRDTSSSTSTMAGVSNRPRLTPQSPSRGAATVFILWFHHVRLGWGQQVQIGGTIPSARVPDSSHLHHLSSPYPRDDPVFQCREALVSLACLLTRDVVFENKPRNVRICELSYFPA